jgi:hypothetical protein
MCVHEVPDLDSDGYMDARCIDERGMPLGNDCDDTDAARFPGNLEVCDDEGHDEDCDLDTRGDVDADGDGFEDIRCCNPAEAGGTNCGDDCDDGRRTVNPGGVEICNGLNDDCDMGIDEGRLVTVYRDADHDGYGVASESIEGVHHGGRVLGDTGRLRRHAHRPQPGAARVLRHGRQRLQRARRRHDARGAVVSRRRR